MFPNHFAMFIWRRKYGASSFRVFLEHVGIVHNPRFRPRFRYARTQDQPEFEESASELDDSDIEEIETSDTETEPDRTIVHNGRVIDFDDFSDGDEENEQFDEVDDVADDHELLM